MPKYEINAYQEIFYKTVIEAEDEDEAQELFDESLGEWHPFVSKSNFEMLQIRKVKEQA